MKLSSAFQLSLVCALAFNTACGAATSSKKLTPGTTVAGNTVVMTPELQTADARVKQAEGQLDLAKKQLAAARSILKAAEADLKAARAEREAIALRTQAQGLAQEAGMRPEGNRALAEADSAAIAATVNHSPAPQAAVTSAPTPLGNNTPVRTQPMEYAPVPAADTEPEAGAVPVELR